MLSAHAGHDASPEAWAYVPMLVLGLVAVAYVVGTIRAEARQGWPLRRTVAFVAGTALLALALSPSFDTLAHDDFGGHAAQHLLLAMVAPLLLVLGMPVTLLLRALPHRAARRIGAFLNTAPVRLLSTPVVALVLTSGGMVVLYFTPLYRWSTESTAVHLLVHVHLVLSGFLFAWVIAGLDPSPHRASVRTRLITLGASIVVHSAVSQLLHAGLWVQVDEPAEELRAAGSLMYYGGDVAELLLALVMLLAATWRGRPQSNAGCRVDTLRADVM